MFLEHLGPRSHVVGVCQPTVATLAAVSIMSEDNNPATPRSMTLMAGPIDTRRNPTRVNKLAKTKDLASQLSNAEWLLSMPGSDDQKTFLLNCVNCHRLDFITRSRHTSGEFLQVMDRMGRPREKQMDFPPAGGSGRIHSIRTGRFPERRTRGSLARRCGVACRDRDEVDSRHCSAAAD